MDPPRAGTADMIRRCACGLVVILFVNHAMSAPQSLEIGLSTRGTRIEGALVSAPPDRDAPAVLLLGGLSGAAASVGAVHAAASRLSQASARAHGARIYAIELANPDAARLEFPPTGTAYREHAESHVLWRWIGLHAPDLVLIAGPDDYGLASALSSANVAEVGRIPARIVEQPEGLLEVRARGLAHSQAHREMQRRRSRT